MLLKLTLNDFPSYQENCFESVGYLFGELEDVKGGLLQLKSLLATEILAHLPLLGNVWKVTTYLSPPADVTFFTVMIN